MCSRIALKSIIDETNDSRIQSMKGKMISLLNVPKGMYMTRKAYNNILPWCIVYLLSDAIHRDHTIL